MSTITPDGKGKHEPNGTTNRESHSELLFRLLGTVLAVSIVLYPAIYATIWHDKIQADIRIQQERINLERERPWPIQPPNSYPNYRDNPPQGAQILEDFAEQQRSARQTAPVQPILSLIDSLVATGSMVAKDAVNLKSEILKAAIDGGKEIVVETVKSLIERFVKVEPKKPESGDTPKNIEINVTQNNMSTPSHSTGTTICPIKKPTHKNPCSNIAR